MAAVAHAGPGCDATVLAQVRAALSSSAVPDPVGLAAAGFEQACKAPGPVLDAARDLPNLAGEQRRLVDLTVATKDTTWARACSAPAALGESIRLSPADGRAHLWQACSLDEIGMFSEAEWVASTGSVVLMLSAVVVLDEVDADPASAEALVRGLVGLSGPRPKSAAAPAQSLRAAGPPAPAPPAPVVPAPAPAPLVTPAPAAVAAPVPAAAAAPVVARDLGPAPIAVDPADIALPDVVTTRASFAEGGQASVRWSKAARAVGGTCTVRIRVGPAGKVARMTWLECAEPLQLDVGLAAERSSYVVATTDGAPVAGAFKATFTVE